MCHIFSHGDETSPHRRFDLVHSAQEREAYCIFQDITLVNYLCFSDFYIKELARVYTWDYKLKKLKAKLDTIKQEEKQSPVEDQGR